MSVRRSCPHDARVPSKPAVRAERNTNRPARTAPRFPWLRFLREHAVALSLIGLFALVALPPALVSPSGALQVIATGALTIFACVLVAAICYESLRR
jgi:hypothetical protein